MLAQNSSHYTYTDGATKIKVKAPITTKTIVDLINELQRRFGPAYKFAPESISKGGILMTEWPEQIPKAYETFRFHFEHQNNADGQWPWVKDETLNIWGNNLPEVIWQPYDVKKPMIGSIFLKAFHGASPWTQNEVEMIIEAMQAVGFQCTAKWPLVRDLKKEGDLGRPLNN